MRLYRHLLPVSAGALALVLGSALVLGLQMARSVLQHDTHVRIERAADRLAQQLDGVAAGQAQPWLTALAAAGIAADIAYDDGRGGSATARAAAAGRAPAWFRRLLPVQAYSVERAVGRRPGPPASLRIGASPAALHDALWRSAQQWAALLAITGAALLALLAVGLRRLYGHMLDGVGRQVGQLLDPAAAAPPDLARELEPIAEAAQRMRLHMQTRLQEHARQIEALRDELKLDPITRLPNRKRFLDQLQLQLAPALATPAAQGACAAPAGGAEDAASRAGATGGHIMVFRLRGLAALNHRMPRHHTDQWLRAMAQRMRTMLGRAAGTPPLLARLNGSDFGVLMPGTAAPEADRIAERIRRELLSINAVMEDEGHMCRWALALSAYRPGQQAATLLALLDHALMRAESEESDRVVRPQSQPALPDAGEYAWRDTLLTALDQHRFSLAACPLAGEDGRVLRHQSLLMLHPPGGGKPVAAPVFMPAAVRLGLAAECDIQAVRLGLDWLVAHEEKLVVGLSWSSLGQEDFLPRLRRLLEDRPRQARMLLLETHALSLIEQRGDMLALAGALAETGAGLGLRGLAQQLGAVAHLHELPLAYVKLGGQFVDTLAASPGSQRLAAAVARTALSQGTEIYAENITDPATRALLQGMGVTILQAKEAA